VFFFFVNYIGKSILKIVLGEDRLAAGGAVCAAGVAEGRDKVRFVEGATLGAGVEDIARIFAIGRICYG